MVQKQLRLCQESLDKWLSAISVEQIQELLGHQRNSSEIMLYARERIEKKTARGMPTLLVPSDNRTSFFRQFAQPKREEPLPKEYICKSKRKVRPTELAQRHSLEETVQMFDTNTAECQAVSDKRGRKAVPGAIATLSDSCLWAFHDCFYCSLDRNYLKEEPLKRLLSEAELPSRRTTYHDQRMIRQALPIPKTFNSDFLASELQKLAQVRAQGRAMPRQKGRESDLAVGKEVIALHPVCGHLHVGTILAIYKENQYMVKFLRPELGTQKVLDILMCPRELSSHQRVVIENVDYEVMALSIKLLEYKSQLVVLLKDYNKRAEATMKAEGKLENTFFQEYGWIGSTINILNLGIRHVISKFRIRGLSPANQQKVGARFGEILINPLIPIERELKKSHQNSDKYAGEQIARMINSHKDSRADQIAKDFYSRLGNDLVASSLPVDKKAEMEKLLRAMIGLLVNMRYESRAFSLQGNKYLKDLIAVVDDVYPEEVNEIFEVLHSITAKIDQQIK